VNNLYLWAINWNEPVQLMDGFCKKPWGSHPELRYIHHLSLIGGFNKVSLRVAKLWVAT